MRQIILDYDEFLQLQQESVELRTLRKDFNAAVKAEVLRFDRDVLNHPRIKSLVEVAYPTK